VAVFSTLADTQCAAGRAGSLALRWLGWNGELEDLTYKQLAEAVDFAAGALLAQGVAPGDAVGVMIGRRVESIIAALAVWKVGGVYCPLFTDLGPDPLLIRLEMVKVKLLIADTALYGELIEPLRDLLPDLSAVLLVGPADQVPSDCGDFHGLCAAAKPLRQPVAVAAGQAAVIHFTSGTTAPVASGGAPPKAVLHDRTVLTAMADSALAAFDLKAGEMIWCTADPGWVTHTAYGLVAPLALGATILLDEVPSAPARCLSVLEDEPVAVWYTTPTVIRGLIGGGAAPARISKPKALRLAASVGEPLSADAVEWGRKVLGVPFRDTWWQTETGAIVLAHDPRHLPIPGSMGKALPGLDVALLRRHEDGIEVMSDGEACGELALRSACLPPWRSLGGEGGALPEELEGWHLSGDMVRRDADDCYWFLGREDEVILAAGRMIGPFEVEAVLMSHPAVAEVGVVGAPDWRSHEHLVAFVAVNPGFEAGEGLRLELMDYAREHLGEALSPQELIFEADMPRTPSGKIIRRALKARLKPAHTLSD